MVSTVSASISHEVMGPDAMILDAHPSTYTFLFYWALNWLHEAHLHWEGIYCTDIYDSDANLIKISRQEWVDTHK